MPCNIDWLAFLVAMAVVELTPGPNMGWLTALSAQKGRRTGFMAVLGITLGLAVQLVAAADSMGSDAAGRQARAGRGGVVCRGAVQAARWLC